MAQFDPFDFDPYNPYPRGYVPLPGTYQRPQAAPNLGLGPSQMPMENPVFTQALQASGLRNPNASVTPVPATPRPRPTAAAAPLAAAPGGAPGPVDPGYQAPFTPGPSGLGTLTPGGAGAPAVAAGLSPDKEDERDLNRAIFEWQMGVGGTGAMEKEAASMAARGQRIGAGARIPGRHAVNQLTRALGGLGEAVGDYQAAGKRKDIESQLNELRSAAMRRQDEIDERRGRGWKKDIESNPLKQDVRFTDLDDPRYG